MKITKKIVALIYIASLFFTSCDVAKNKNSKFYDKPNVKIVALDDGKEVMVRKDYYGTYSFNKWNAYNVANTEIHRIEEAKYRTSKKRLLNLSDKISNLPNTIPNWLKTEEVMEDIDDVQEEYSKLYEERNESTKNVKQNWEELTEKFDDLREELSETVEDYDA